MVWGQKLDEALFNAQNSSGMDLSSAWSAYVSETEALRADQMGFQVSLQFSWLVAPAGFEYNDGLNILTRTGKVLHPEWSENQANDFSQVISNSGIWHRFSDNNRSARPWGVRGAWVSESLLPISLSLGAGKMGIDFYIEGRLTADDSPIGLNAHQLRAVTFIDDYFRMQEEFGSVWWFPQDPSTPEPFSAMYLEAGIGKRVHPLASLFLHYRQPIGVANQIRSNLAAENTAFDEPTVTIRDGADAHFGPIFCVQAQYHGKYLQWGIERVTRWSPTGTWPDYLVEHGAIPFQNQSHTELSIGIRF